VQEDQMSHCTMISHIPNKLAFRYHLNCPLGRMQICTSYR